MSAKDILYPDPQSIPVPPSPSYQQPIPLVTLSELIPGKYVSTIARIVYVRTVERQDALGSKTIFSGILEDSTFKVPFVSQRISHPLIRNSIYKFDSAYVHEFLADKSLLLVLTEHTKIDSKNVEDYREYIWTPKIESIKRPVRSVSLNGVITTVHNNSGLVKRCNKCKSIIYDTCPNKCSQQEGWGWDLRVSSRLYDGSGSIKMVLTKDIASRVLHRNLSELILFASQDKPLTQYQQQQPSSFKIKIPESIEIIEAVTENASSFRSNGKLIVTDGRNLVFFTPEEEAHKLSEHIKRPLKASDIEDRKIIKKLIEKALDISLKKVTGMRMMQGIYLLEEPISLYRWQEAQLCLYMTSFGSLLIRYSFHNMSFHSALEQFNEHRNTWRMTTGSADLDSLIDGIQEGLLYLFYGNNRLALDALVYTFLVNCVLPIKHRHGFESMAVCLNNVDYYDQRKTAALSPEKIGVAAKCAGIDPKIVFKNMYVHPAYNQQHQLTVAEQVADLIESNNDIKLLIVNNITKFFRESKNKMEAANILKQVIGIISRACIKNKVAVVCTGDANTTAKGIIARPIGGIYLKHVSNVIVHFKEFSKTSGISSFKATLIKHQYAKTPKSAVMYVRKAGGMMLLD